MTTPDRPGLDSDRFCLRAQSVGGGVTRIAGCQNDSDRWAATWLGSRPLGDRVRVASHLARLRRLSLLPASADAPPPPPPPPRGFLRAGRGLPGLRRVSSPHAARGLLAAQGAGAGARRPRRPGPAGAAVGYLELYKVSMCVHMCPQRARGQTRAGRNEARRAGKTDPAGRPTEPREERRLLEVGQTPAGAAGPAGEENRPTGRRRNAASAAGKPLSDRRRAAAAASCRRSSRGASPRAESRRSRQ